MTSTGCRIDHEGEARALLAAADAEVSANHPVNTGEDKADLLANAQVHATLALLEQQRIANIITVAGWVIDSSPGDVGHDLDKLRPGVAGEVWEALGLLTSSASGALDLNEERAIAEATEPIRVEMREPVYVLRGGAYLLDEHAGVLFDSAGNYSAKTRGNPMSLAALLRAVADDIEENESMTKENT